MHQFSRQFFLNASILIPFGLALPSAATAQETLNVYSIWPENWARPMLQEFENATGIKVNFLRFSSGEALARVIAEKNNPRVDVLFGGPVETFAAGIKEDMFEPYKPPAFAMLPARFKQADGQWTAIADDPLVFMTNAKFLAENKLNPPASWDDLLNPAYKGMLQMADARTSGTAVTRIFSVLEVNGRDEEKAFAYPEEAAAERAALHQERRRRHLPVGLGQAGGGIFFIVDALETKAKGYDVVIASRRRASAPSAEGDRADQGREEPRRRQKADRLGDQPGDAIQALCQAQGQLRAGASGRADRGVARRGAEGRQDLSDRRRYAGANRKRIVDRWVDEILPSAVTPWLMTGAARARRVAATRRCSPPSSCCGLLLALFVIYPLVMLAGARLRRRRPASARAAAERAAEPGHAARLSQFSLLLGTSVGVLGTALGFLFAFTAVRAAWAGTGSRCSTRRRCCRWSRRPSRPRSRSSSHSDPRASSPTSCWASPTSRPTASGARRWPKH